MPPRQAMADSPTTRSLDRLRKRGWTPGIVERRCGKFVTVDLFGFADILAMKHGETPVLIQTTTGSNLAARRTKIYASGLAALALEHERISAIHEGDPFTEDELRRLLAVADHPRDRALLMLLISGGLRASELIGIHTDAISWKTGTSRVLGKGSKVRDIAPGAGAMVSLRRLLGLRQGWVWVRLDGRAPDRPIKRESLWRIVRELGSRADVEDCHPHRFRTTYAVMFLEYGGDAGALKESLGHNSLTMALHYASYGATQRALDTQRRLSLADRVAG